jgi:hypothetical protein
MRLVLPLLKALEVEPYLLELILNKIVLMKDEKEEPVRVAKGTKV